MKHIPLLIAAAMLLIMSSCGFNKVDFKAAHVNCDGCPEVILSGVTASVEVPVIQPYQKLEVCGLMQLIYTDSIENVMLSADSALLPYFKSRVDDGTLYLSLDSVSVADSFSAVVYIPQNPELSAVELSGVTTFETAVPISSRQFDLEGSGVCSLICRFDMPDGKLNMEFSGVSSVEAEGQVAEANIDISGVGSLEAYDLVIQHCTLDLSGTSSVELRCEQHLKADLSGMCALSYRGACTTEIDKNKLSSVDKDEK